jgi:peptidoglycan hydrolase-like protein with peptidoglycan-binding domain
MKKTIKLTESDLEQIVRKLLREQSQENINPKNLKFGDRGPEVAALQQRLMDKGFLKLKTKKPTQYFGNLTQSALNLSQGKTPITPQKKGQIQTKGCPTITPKSDLKDLTQIVQYWSKAYPKVETYGLINRMINRHANNYKAKGIPERTSCEIALIQVRPGYKDKNGFILDSKNKLLYLFDREGSFIAKTQVITGKNKQSQDPKVIANALMIWSEKAGKLGFKWENGKGYVDTTGKNRKYHHDLVYDASSKNKTKFLPKGIYTTSTKIKDDKDYAGQKQNLIHLTDGLGREIAQAIHGYYIEQPRTQALNKAKEVLSNPDNPEVGNEFLKLVSGNRVNLSQSYGCINIPENFLGYLREYGQNSYVFNMGEDQENYLVNNTQNYFNKMTSSESCPSPQSLGAQPVTDFSNVA